MSEQLLCTVKESVSLTFVDPAAGTIIDTVKVGEAAVAKPHEIVLSADDRLAFVSIYGSADYGRNQSDNRIAVVDLEQRRLVRHIDLDLYRAPHALARDAKGRIWVTVEESQSVLAISPESLEIERCVWVQVPVHFITTHPSRERLYVSHKQYPFVTEIDALTDQVTHRIDLPVGAQAISTSPDGALLYVGDFHRPLLHEIDLEARSLTRTVPLAGVPGWPYPTPDGRYVIVTTWIEAEGRGFIEILEAESLNPAHVIEIEAEPFHALLAHDKRHLYVVLGTGHIAVVDLETGALERKIDVGGSMPEAILHLPQ
ncbi:MAG: hypothetical protein HKN60_07470 [Rhizobiales bacterium]|nr:hypothetical protein [Hyphomicrobiales bacterium]